MSRRSPRLHSGTSTTPVLSEPDLQPIPEMGNPDELNNTLVNNDTNQPLSIISTDAEAIQTHMMSQVNALFARMQQQQLDAQEQQKKLFQELATEVRAIGQRVRNIENPSEQTNHQETVSVPIVNGANLSADNTTNNPTTSSAPPTPLTSATSWNRATSLQFSGENALAQKPFELPSFSGKASQWPIFISAYRQSTAAFRYTSLQNVFRLQKCLEGEARMAVESLLMNPDNLEELIETLELRFGRPEQLCNDQIAKIREFPSIKEDQYERLINYSSQVSNTVAFLNTDASRHVLSESALISEMLNKLPQTRKYEWLQHTETIAERPNAVDFAKWLRTIAVRISRLPIQITATTASNTQRPANGGRGREERRVLLNIGECCALCERSHRTSECDKFRQQTVSERWATARRIRVCFGCLQQGHSFAKCKQMRRGGYHELLRERKDNLQKHHRVKYSEVDRCNNNPAKTNEGEGVDEAASAVPTTTMSTKRINPFTRVPPAPTVLTCQDEFEFPLLFRVVPVLLFGPDRSVNTYALLDEGSSVTLIDSDLAADLGLDGPARQMDLKWIGNHSTSRPSKAVALKISGAEKNSTRFELKDVFTVDRLNLPTQSFTLSTNDNRHDHIRDLPVTTYRHAVPTILVGLDHSHLGVASRTRINHRGGPIAAKTRLGWVIYGRQTDGVGKQVLHCREADDRYEALDQLIREFHTTEAFGVKQPEKTLESDEDARARMMLEKSTIRIGERFQTGLLWRSDNECLPDSYRMAMQRYDTVRRKMKRDDAYARLYVRQMEDLLTKRYATRLTAEEAAIRDERTWFLPHFGVQSIFKPGKLRIVFDAAATVNGVSLNSALLKGPDLNQPLQNILLQFRMRRVGICADISEMFLQVGMQPDDRRSQRFLWRSDGGWPPDIYQMNVMTFGATCSPTSAQYTKNLNASEFEDEFPEAAKAIRTLHYVDDFVASFGSEKDATRITRDVVEVHRRGGFKLRGFVSNSRTVLNELGANTDINYQQETNMELDSKANEKILGLRWQTQTDSFIFSFRFEKIDSVVLNGQRAPTKREVLSVMMSVFDPFGFLSDVMLHAKVMVQDLWRIGIGWDEPVPEQINKRWQAWCNILQDVKCFQIPRCYSPHLLESTDVQLHCFADASEEAFAAVGYWRIRHGDEYTIAFIAGKTRCAPLKQLSVPRLELQAAVLATRLHNMIRENHNINISKTVLWTDSRTVMQWLQSSERRFRPFVAHRVSEVLESTGVSWWRWLPTKENVADDATRCRAPPRFEADCRWIRGPVFLHLDETKWPTTPTAVINNTEEELPEEIRHRFAGVLVRKSIFNVNRFSSFHRLSRTVAWTLRFINNAKRAIEQGEKRKGPLSSDELEKATIHLCRIAQAEGYPDEYEALMDGKPIAKSSSIYTLMPYLDCDKTMRVYGRTDAANPQYLPESAQRPILLPNKHRLTELIVSMHHARMSHQFEGGTICSVRRQFWVPNLRSLVRTCRRTCQACKIRTAKPKPPVAGQLPIDRMSPYEPPFSYTGVDYFGPVQITVGRRKEKRWICLFTCLTIRAVHMEVAENLSTDACLVCVRNFCNLRGVPKRFRSDCGTNFIGADNELKKMAEVFDCDEIHQELSTKGIDWIFNCPANPEAGGSWERLVQSAKKVLAVTLKEIAPRVETLRSYIIEAANILNSRPLTNIPVSPEDLAPLTPNHFLLGRINATTRTSEFEPRQMCHRKQWRVLTQLKNHFWSRWVAEYLPELTGRKKRYDDEEPLKKGDLVLICDANQTRGQWLRGRIERVLPGKDGRVRVAEVRTKDGLLKRPLSKLAVLHVDDGKSAEADLRGPGCRRASN